MQGPSLGLEKSMFSERNVFRNIVELFELPIWVAIYVYQTRPERLPLEQLIPKPESLNPMP